jgi:hypothetical protein
MASPYFYWLGIRERAWSAGRVVAKIMCYIASTFPSIHNIIPSVAVTAGFPAFDLSGA